MTNSQKKAAAEPLEYCTCKGIRGYRKYTCMDCGKLTPRLKDYGKAAAEQTSEIEKILDSIDKDVFDCGDALQNAYGTLKHRRPFDSAAVEKAEEYLRDWPPVWMRDELFIPSQVPEKIGTDKIRDFIRQQEERIKTLEADSEAQLKLIRILSDKLSSFSPPI